MTLSEPRVVEHLAATPADLDVPGPTIDETAAELVPLRQDIVQRTARPYETARRRTPPNTKTADLFRILDRG